MGWNPPNNLTTSTPHTPLAFGATAYSFQQSTGKVTRHVVIETEVGQLIELHANPGSDTWSLNNLTVSASAPPARQFGLANGYIWSKQPSQHVIYEGHLPNNPAEDGHVHELWWTEDDGWNHHDLTNATHAPLMFGPPFGFETIYETEYDPIQRVVYIGQDGQTIHELYNHGGGWHHDLVGGVQPSNAEALTAYSFDGEAHVLVTTNSRHILEFINGDTGWTGPTDLTTLTGAPPIGPAGGEFPASAGYVFDGQRTQHVIYSDPTGHIIELVWDDTRGWLQTPPYKDLTTGLGIIAALPGSPACYAFEADATQHIFFLGADSYVHELKWDNNGPYYGWNYNVDFDNVSKPAARNSDVMAFVDVVEGTQNVFYVSDPQDVIELQWTP